jgi:hypothetical protein
VRQHECDDAGSGLPLRISCLQWGWRDSERHDDAIDRIGPVMRQRDVGADAYGGACGVLRQRVAYGIDVGDDTGLAGGQGVAAPERASPFRAR